MTTKPKVALYARVSKDDFRGTQASMTEQKHIIRALAKKHGYEVDETLTFSDTASAKKPERPGFEEMKKAIEDGNAKSIIVWKINRLALNPIDGGWIIWKLQQGVIEELITEEGTYTPKSDMLMLHIHFGMANQFSLNISRREKPSCSECEHDCRKRPEEEVWL